MRKGISTTGFGLAVVLAVVSAYGCSTLQEDVSLSPDETALPAYGLVPPQQAYDIIGALYDDPTFVLLDLRTDPEVSAGHISRATNLDFYSTTFASRLSALDRNAKYLIYCRTGNRTGQAYNTMMSLGLESVYELDGGITDWIAQGLPVCVGELSPEHACIAPAR